MRTSDFFPSTMEDKPGTGRSLIEYCRVAIALESDRVYGRETFYDQKFRFNLGHI